MPASVSVSVVVVTFDSEQTVASSLPAIAAELDGGDELIVVDNASVDRTVERVAELCARARVLVQSTNVGFAAACNAGATIAGGDLLVFLNPDAVAEPGFGAAIRRPLAEGRGWGAWMGLVTAERGAVINTSGGVVHFTGIAWAGRAGEPAASVPGEPDEVTFASGACLAVPREVWERAGGFPEAFFMYCEDVDLSLRLWLWDMAVGIEPSARVDHDYAFLKGPQKWRLLERNRWATIVRTYPAPLLAVLVPALLATELALVAIAVASGWGRAKLLATADTARALPRLLRERRAIQAGRRVTTAAFASHLTPALTSTYLGRAGRSRVLGLALRAYWAFALAVIGARRSG